jgi:sarcosine oxidase, subunit alpha
MMSRRIQDHPVLGPLKETNKIKFTFDDKELYGYEGETLAAALLANDIRVLRYHEEMATPRGFYCNIGHCFECRVDVNRKQVRSCLTVLEEGMEVQSGTPLPTPFMKGEK